jgi:hypothetical protein
MATAIGRNPTTAVYEIDPVTGTSEQVLDGRVFDMEIVGDRLVAAGSFELYGQPLPSPSS